MLWFLNKHSRKIYLATTSGNIIKKLQSMGSTITYLNMKESLATENMIHSILCCVPNVINLNLSYTCCFDKTLLLIQRMCPKITDLNLDLCRSVTDRGMNNLCGINQALKTLNIDGTKVTVKGVSVILKGMPNLECLKHDEFPEMFYFIHKEQLESTYDGTFYNITELKYEYVCTVYVLDVLQIWADLCPKLNKVSVPFSLSYKELLVCSKMKNLQYLEIGSLDGYERDHEEDYLCILTPFIPRDDILTTLILSSTKIPTKELIGGFKNLKTLSLHDVNFSNFEEEDILPNKNKLEVLVLEELCLTALDTYRAILKLLTVCKGVTELHLCLIKVIPVELFQVILNSMDYLTVADFSFTPVTVPLIQKFFQLPYLKTIYLDGCWNISSIDDFKGTVLKEPTNSLSWCPKLDESH